MLLLIVLLMGLEVLDGQKEEKERKASAAKRREEAYEETATDAREQSKLPSAEVLRRGPAEVAQGALATSTRQQICCLSRCLTSASAELYCARARRASQEEVRHLYTTTTGGHYGVRLEVYKKENRRVV